MVSDTIFAGGENSKEGLEKLVDYSRYMLETGIHNAFPLRGAITFGDVIWHPKVTFGEAIARAYETANDQNWIGTICSTPLPHINLLWESGKILYYAPQTKQSLMSHRPVISWQVPTFEEMLINTSKEGLTNPTKAMSWHQMNIIDNTVLFSIYLKKIKEVEEKIKPRRLDRSRVYYFSVTHMLDSDTNSFPEAKEIVYDPTVPP